jgi:3-hydroxy-9,10-secoandrosta-1,3,5(10)-triene-9,17-dione monooxygenase reductase component
MMRPIFHDMERRTFPNRIPPQTISVGSSAADRTMLTDLRRLRDALGCFATGVCIVTTHRRNGKREGLTVNSFSSVSLSPPMVLWSLARSAASLPAFVEAEFYAIHVLAAEQEPLSRHFASRAVDKFAGIDLCLTDGINGVPLIEGVSARFQCRNEFRTDGGDHVVFIGRVEAFEHWEREPLLFHRGRYVRLDAALGLGPRPVATI